MHHIVTHDTYKFFLLKLILQNTKFRKIYNTKYSHSKYSLETVIDGILYVLRNGIAWREFRGNITWSSLYWHFKRFVRFKMFQKIFHKLRKYYFRTSKTNIQIIDSTFIPNKLGKCNIARNKFYKSKNGNKISFVTDKFGIPLSILFNSGNVHDLSFISMHINDLSKLNTSKI